MAEGRSFQFMSEERAVPSTGSGEEAFEKRRGLTQSVGAEKDDGGGVEGNEHDSGGATAITGNVDISHAKRSANNASLSILADIKTLTAIEDTPFESLDASTWGVLKASAGSVRAHLSTTEDYINALTTRIRELEQQRLEKPWEGPTGQGASSGGNSSLGKWSQGNPFANSFANSSTNSTVYTNPTPPATKIEDTRRQRQILIRLEDGKERESTMGKAGDILLAAFRSGQHAHTGQIVAVNRLQSGDLLLQTTTISAREALEETTTWAKRVYKSAVVIKKTFPVMIHGMRISAFDVDDQAATRAKVEADNKGLHPGLVVRKTRWVSNVAKEVPRGLKPKLYSSLIINVATTTMVNDILDKGLVEGGEMKKVAFFEPSASSIQCFNCQEYGHMSKSCKNKTSCAECKQAHDTRDHARIAPNAPKACATCGETGHTSYDKMCPVKVKEAQRTRQRIANKPSRYRTAECTIVATDSAGFTTVVPKKKRKAPVDAIEVPRSQFEDTDTGSNEQNPNSNSNSNSNSSPSSSNSSSNSASRGRPPAAVKLMRRETGQSTLDLSNLPSNTAVTSSGRGLEGALETLRGAFGPTQVPGTQILPEDVEMVEENSL